MRQSDYARLGGHVNRVRPLEDVLRSERLRVAAWDGVNPWPADAVR